MFIEDTTITIQASDGRIITKSVNELVEMCDKFANIASAIESLILAARDRERAECESLIARKGLSPFILQPISPSPDRPHLSRNRKSVSIDDLA